ncbi:type II toxin-antitoxin system YafO family toxin [Pseudomonas syringae]|uniref:type II toxin-antitoxin system YafO family toxin n=1 Tax=Pseudomonas syringae TaxID=317 RepID=UPI00200A2BD3|nr:type II toxin-antitoxin system YafO family toxin [Pseudomonas syringae]MCK9691864.1 type II toxin-antitoxin system YafO family toxin [Pseudomonas syringae pv. syringae]
MAANVSFHPATYDEFFKPIDLKYPGLSAKIASDFKDYIDSKQLHPPKYFGRDAPYTQPQAAQDAHLSHIHIKLPPGSFRQDRAQYYRVCQFNKPGEDAALVYVQGQLEEDQYLILAFFWPDAHAMARNNGIMRYLCHLAKTWRDEH